MDKNAIRKFAIYAREELIKRVTIQAATYGVTGKDDDAGAVNAGDRVFSPEEREWRGQLVRRIRRDGFEQVMEEVAYTWFNRFCALRFMEVNGYLPSRVRVFTDEANAFRPQMLAEALHLELEGLDRERVLDLKGKNDDEALYRYLLITQCNALAGVLPGLFQRLDAETSLLCPDNLLHEDSVLAHLVADIPEEDWRDQVQVIGWLYQYYNAVPKDMVFAALKKNIKVSKENIPAATQLFTPDWIVRYMVENSLGRLWLEGHPDAALRAGWKYYLDEAEQEPAVAAELAKLRADRAALRPEEIRCIDPCMGSGHILVYMFDVLMQIYRACGYPDREAVQSIVQNNLYGLDIDERAAQLAYFAVMMKAVQYDRRFLRRGVQPHVCAVPESAPLPEEAFAAFGEDADAARRLHAAFLDGKEYGSLTEPGVTLREVSALRHRMLTMHIFDPQAMKLDSLSDALDAVDALSPLVDAAEMLLQKYDVAATNPPYMGASNMNAVLAAFVKKEYPDSKGDMSTCFMERTLWLCKSHGFMAMLNIPVWMFLSSYEKLRLKMIQSNTFINMVHPGRGIFGSDFGTTTFVADKQHINGYIGSYRRLFKKQGEVESVEEREQAFLSGKGCYTAQQDNFSKIPGAPVAYWVSERLLNDFSQGKPLEETAHPRQGIKTADKDRFLRHWYEVCFSRTSLSNRGIHKWFPCNKGGAFRKWYGNNDYVVNWYNNGEEICNYRDENGKLKSRPQNLGYMLQEGLTYTNISSSTFGVRYCPSGYIYDAAGSGIFCNDTSKIMYVLAYLTSKVASLITKITSPTMSFEVGQIGLMPLIFCPYHQKKINLLVDSCIRISKEDWDSYETSWDFQRHPLLQYAAFTPQQVAKEEASGYLPLNGVADAYAQWKAACESRFQQLKANEEELNRIFIDIYGLQDELTPEVADRDVTVHRVFDTKEDVPESMKGSNYVRTKRDEVVSLIAYAVGCMFGRYSLDVPGLVLAGQPFGEKFVYASVPVTDMGAVGEPIPDAEGDCYLRTDEGLSKCSFAPDRDGILPICDDEYFEDDIVGMFARFLEAAYGKQTLEDNLRFVAEALGGSGAPREVIRAYFLNDFFADHCKTYQKRPIYWLFDSGKKNGFKALIYMHRYAPDTIARIRTDYLHEQQSRYRTAIAGVETRLRAAEGAERVRLSKQLEKLQAQAEEARLYEEKIHHLADQMIAIDLDDGVKVNYAKFADVLAKIK